MKSIALLVLTAVLSLLPVMARGAPSETTATNPMTVRGTLSAWRLDMDGTVYLRLRELPPEDPDQREKGGRTLWFRTPPDRSVSMAVEDLVLSVALTVGPETPITVSAEADREASGAEPEASFELNWITKD